MAEDLWTIRRMLEWCTGYLERNGDESPRRSAETLVGDACSMERIELYLDMDRPLSSLELDVLRDTVRKRAKGTPLQYLTGKAPFRYLELEVAPGVLIPRPETEVLVSEALAVLPPAPKPQDAFDAAILAAMAPHDEDAEDDPDPSQEPDDDDAAQPGSKGILVADICTGSGCIACSMATEHPDVHVVATDISPQAVALARRNAASCGVDGRVQVVECDLGTGVDGQLMGSFDAVLSNPPYVPTKVLQTIPREVADYEPVLALDGGDDGLDVFRRLLPWSWNALKEGGHLVVELHEETLDDAVSLARSQGFSECRVVRDLAGRPRVVVARK